MIVPVILCGGSGTRLWPLSRRAYPKQLLNLVGDHSLLQQTVTRLEGIRDMAPPLLISNEEHRFLVAEQMREIGVEPQRIILEPVGRNTAPAVCLALEWAAEHATEATFLILPSDHVIEDLAAFQHAVAAAVALADQDYLVTFGIAPTSPETGYGYVERGNPIESLGFELQRFVEKPSSQLAAEYIASGQFSWNGGMFAFKRQVACDAFKEWAKPIADAVKQAWSGRTEDLNFSRPDSEGFAQCPSDSIDYAVMEHVKHAAIVPMDAGWSDLGSWASVWDIGDKTEAGNVFSGDVIAENTEHTLIKAEHRLVGVAGVSGLTIIETADSVLVADREASQSIKTLVAKLEESGREESVTHRRIYRPWGWYESVDQGDRHQVKRILVNPGSRLSLQKHEHRAEHWIVVKGKARVTRGDEVLDLLENQSTYIPQGCVHRLENLESTPLEIIEVQSGSYLGEDDITRLDDEYGRT